MYIHKTIKQKEDECLALLRSTNRDRIEDLISHITKMGYFIAPGSLEHHRFVGGLVSHSLETFHKAMQLREKKIQEGFNPSTMPDESVIIAALMHDLCKADVLRFNIDVLSGRLVIQALFLLQQKKMLSYGTWEGKEESRTNKNVLNTLRPIL